MEEIQEDRAKVALFNFDNTLFDSRHALYAAFYAVFQQFHVHLEDLTFEDLIELYRDAQDRIREARADVTTTLRQYSPYTDTPYYGYDRFLVWTFMQILGDETREDEVIATEMMETFQKTYMENRRPVVRTVELLVRLREAQYLVVLHTRRENMEEVEQKLGAMGIKHLVDHIAHWKERSRYTMEGADRFVAEELGLETPEIIWITGSTKTFIRGPYNHDLVTMVLFGRKKVGSVLSGSGLLSSLCGPELLFEPTCRIMGEDEMSIEGLRIDIISEARDNLHVTMAEAQFLVSKAAIVIQCIAKERTAEALLHLNSMIERVKHIAKPGSYDKEQLGKLKVNTPIGYQPKDDITAPPCRIIRRQHSYRAEVGKFTLQVGDEDDVEWVESVVGKLQRHLLFLMDDKPRGAIWDLNVLMYEVEHRENPFGEMICRLWPDRAEEYGSHKKIEVYEEGTAMDTDVCEL